MNCPHCRADNYDDQTECSACGMSLILVPVEQPELLGEADLVGQPEVFGEADLVGQPEVFGEADLVGQPEVFGEPELLAVPELLGEAAPQPLGEPEILGPLEVVQPDVPASCPHCGAAHTPEQGRFCDTCGMSVVHYARRGEAAPSDDPDQPKLPPEDEWPRCRACGTKTAARICPGCGGKMPEPDQ